MSIDKKFCCSLAVGLLLALTRPAAAQTPVPTTVVMVNLTMKPDFDRAALTRTMPDEIRETVQAYLDGKIQQWFARADGRGVMFLLNCRSVAEAEEMMKALPLAKANLANFEYTPLGPLSPLRLLLGPPQVKPQ